MATTGEVEAVCLIEGGWAFAAVEELGAGAEA
jgi:hypothetical protein